MFEFDFGSDFEREFELDFGSNFEVEFEVDFALGLGWNSASAPH